MKKTKNLGLNIYDPITDDLEHKQVEYINETDGYSADSNMNILDEEVAKRLIGNEPIVAGVATKITYDANGLVTNGEDIAVDDLPIATQEEAEAGTSNEVLMTPLLTKQSLKNVKTYIDWKAEVQKDTWSRIFTSANLTIDAEPIQVGHFYLLSVTSSRDGSHFQYAFLIQLGYDSLYRVTTIQGGGSENASFGIRVLKPEIGISSGSGVLDVKISDGIFDVADKAELYCKLFLINGEMPTTVEAFQDDTALPEGFIVAQNIIAKPDVISNMQFESLTLDKPPLIVASKALVENLNAQYIGGLTVDDLQKGNSFYSITLLASGWSGENAPYGQSIELENIKADSGGIVSLDHISTDAQRIATMEAMIKTIQENGKIVFNATGKKPSIDIKLYLEIVG